MKRCFEHKENRSSARAMQYFFLFGLIVPQWFMASSFTRFLDHTQWHTTVGRASLDEWSARRRDLYLTSHNTHNRDPGGIRTHNLSRRAAADLRISSAYKWLYSELHSCTRSMDVWTWYLANSHAVLSPQSIPCRWPCAVGASRKSLCENPTSSTLGVYFMVLIWQYFYSLTTA